MRLCRLSSTSGVLVTTFAIVGVVGGFGCSGIDEQDQSAQTEAIYVKPASDSTSFLTIVSDPQSLPHDTGSRGCGELQEHVQESVGDEDESVYENHGAYVSAVSNLVSPHVEPADITEECAGCIINQFARSVPVADQQSCGLQPCTGTITTPEEIRDAVFSLIFTFHDPWGNVDDFQLFVTAVEDEIGCSLTPEDSNLEGDALRQQTEIAGCAAVGTSPKYCGPSVGIWNPLVPSCLNEACCEHDACYEDCGVGNGIQCTWTESTETCDTFSALVAICSGEDNSCNIDEGGSLLGGQLVCALVDAMFLCDDLDCTLARVARNLACFEPPTDCGECTSNEDCDDGEVCVARTCIDDAGGLEIVKQIQVDTGGYASGIVVSPDESKLYVAYWEDENSSRVQEFSLPDLALLQTFTFGSYHTHGDVVVSGDGTRIFTTNYYYSSISQIDLANGNARTDLSTVDTWPASIAITADRNKVLAGVGQDGRSYDMGNDRIAIYDISGGTFSLLASVELQDEPRGHSFGVSQDSRFAYVATRKRQSSNPKLYEVSLEAPFEVTRTLDFPEASYELVYTRCLGSFVYVSDPENSKIWVVDRTSWTKVGYDLESAPRPLELHPSGAYLFALMPDIGSVVAIDVGSMSIVARYDGLSSGANDIEFNNDGTKMYVAHRSYVGEIMVFELSW